MGLIKDLEKVQMRATKLVMKLKHLKYKERLGHMLQENWNFCRFRYDYNCLLRH